MKNNMRKFGLVSSIIALVVCLVLVVGSTFSLFTGDTDSTIDVNTAKVEIDALIDAESLELYSKGIEQTEKFENGGTATFTEENTVLTLKNVAPGDEAKFNIVITNTSTIDIQYRITCTYDGKLAEVLVATANGAAIENGTSDWAEWTITDPATKTLEISVKLPIDAENEYQVANANVHFDIEAVQANAVQSTNVTTADQLYTALTMDGFAVLADDVVLDKTLTISKDAEIYLAGHTITNANGDAIVNNANLTIYDGMPSTVYSLRRSAEAEESIGAIVSGKGSAIVNNGSLTINGGIFEGTDAAAVVNTEEAEELVIEAGSFVANNVDTFAIEYVVAETVTINKGEFTGAAPADMDKLVGEGVGATTNKDGNLVFAPAVITTVTNTDELLAAFANAQSGEIIDASGVNYSITGAEFFEIPAGITLRGLTITASYRGGNYVTYGSGDDAITFEDCSFGNSDRTILVCGTADGPDSVVFKNCTFTGQVITNYVANANGVAEFYGCTFTKSPRGYNFLECMGGSHIFYDCTFDYTGLSQSSMGVLSTATLNVYSESDGSYATYVETNGCTFINCGTRKYGAKSTLVIK